MRDTTWNGALQTMVRVDGKAKGMKMILEERGVDTKNMRAEDMRKKFKTCLDFKNQKTLLEEYIEGHYMCVSQKVFQTATYR